MKISRWGGLNKYLVRPMGYKRYLFFRFLGTKSSQSPDHCPCYGRRSSSWHSCRGIPISAGRTAAFLVSLSLAIILNFSIYFCIGLFGFWLTDAGQLFGTISIVLT